MWTEYSNLCGRRKRSSRREDEKLTRSKDINTSAVVGEVGPLVAQSGCANGNGLLRSGGGVLAGISVVIA